MVRRARMRVGKGSRWKMGVRVRHAPNWSDKSAHNQPALTPQPVRQIVLTATRFNPTTPPQPRPSHCPKVNATTQNALGWWARRRTPNDGDYPAHSSTQRSSNAPTARPQGQQRSEASSQTSSPEAQRGSGTATRPAAPPPLLRIAAAPQPQHRR